MIRRSLLAMCGLAGLAGCGSIGDGNTIETIELIDGAVAPYEQGVRLDVDLPTERFHMYDCFCSSIIALARFNDGSVVNFSNRVTFTSSNPSVVAIRNADDPDTTDCPAGQQVAGLLAPKSLGTATITATFASLSAELQVEVADASVNSDGSPAGYVLRAAPPASPTATDVAVAARLPLQLVGTLDGRERSLTANVTEWTFDNDDAALATVDASGVVTGVGATAGAPRAVRATFASCSDVSPTMTVNVGDVVEPLALEREAPDFATDGMLAEQTDERLVVTAPLDFDGNGTADGAQLVSDLIHLDTAEPCILREYDATVPTTFCRETPTTCTSTVSVPNCSSTTCESGMTACRTLGPSVISGGNNRMRALVDRGAPASIFATFPGGVGTPTELAGAVADGAVTTMTVDALTGYPTTTPWYAVIDKAGNREDVRVTAVSGTTLTVDRGIGGTAAVAHADGATFEQRSYASDASAPLMLRAKEGTLTTVTLEPPGPLAALGVLQMSAQGIFVDAGAVSRQQRVTRMIETTVGAVKTEWLSSDTSVALFSSESRGLLFSAAPCGGRFDVRVRADSSTDDSTEAFDPDTTADDDACKNTDPLCDQVAMCIATPSPLPLGLSCDTVTTCP